MIHVENNNGKVSIKVKGSVMDIMADTAALLTSIVGNALKKDMDEASIRSIYSTIIHTSYDFILEEHGLDMLPSILAAATGISEELKVELEEDDEDEDPIWDADTSLADEVKRMMKDKGVMF